MNRKEKVSIALALSSLFIAYLGMGLASPVMPSIAEELSLNGAVVGYLFAVMAFAQFLASPFTGVWVDSIGRKKMIVIGLLLFSFSEALFGFADETWLLFVSRLLGGVSAAFIMPAVVTYVTDKTTLSNRAKVLGYQSAAISLGFIIGPGVGGLIAEFGIRAPFFFASAISLIATIIIFILLDDSITVEQLQKNRASAVRPVFIQEYKKSFQPKYFTPLLIVFILAFGLAVYEMMFSLFVDEKFGFTIRDISIVITVGSIAGVVAQIIFFDKLVNVIGERMIINLTLLSAAIFIFLTILIDGYLTMIVVTSIVFFSCDILRPAVTSFLSKIAGKNQGYIAGMNSAYTSLGIILGPIIGGILFDINIDMPYIFATIVLVIAFVISSVKLKKPNLN
ncbi:MULTISPECIES: MFS transporter [Peribacillus]|uniref:MFS transporter n=1 Tax=Peribacillus castrilensis TaxID=2897690 RepID=A0AAW9NKT9_9BACI|nr:MFS transporter [Peribacillus frigoritolerans]MEC0275807.1 MFS transporter [Peribacillus castrilensis]MEC0301113.1 MFS transporter [Peribacillus castrilensis]MEC0344913.1 MFS transporter [Peribacillus castrilensis]TFH62299.1 MFS transporter [Peribacillus frigoritolerans]